MENQIIDIFYEIQFCRCRGSRIGVFCSVSADRKECTTDFEQA